MRTPSNETRSLDIADVPAAEETGPERTCVLTRTAAPRQALIRLALAPDGQVLPDIRARAPGRGAWIGVDRPALETAIAKGRLRGALSRAFKTGEIAIAPDLPARIAELLERQALDRLGLEARAGYLLTGSDRIEQAAREGRLQLLLHAADAGADGSRRLAQAWRVGSDREGSDLKGLTIPAPRTILSLALGRENVVHVGLTDAQAARRVREALTRWLHFIGSDPMAAPCDSGSQAPSATAPELNEAAATSPARDDGDDAATKTAAATPRANTKDVE